jgi:beta-lactamase superfamily II metal-dependent hydrolase
VEIEGGERLMPFSGYANLNPDRLYLIVIGPGVGETVLIRVPPDQWLVVDSFKCGSPKQAAAVQAIRWFGGNVAAVALTHPHADHYQGIIDLIEYNATSLLACVHPRDAGPVGGLANDATAHLREGAKPAYTRMWDECQTNPGRRWDTFRDTSRMIGTATVTALHPTRPVNPAAWSADPNVISSPMLVAWENVKVLLGGDVPNSEWPAIAAAFPDLANHSAMKVPHHGSREAVNASFGNGLRSRLWLVTPSKRQGLPRANDLASDGTPEGLAKILGFLDEVSLTSLPFRHKSEADRPCRTTRPQIRRNAHPVRVGEVNGNLMTSSEALNRHVIVGFDGNGTIAEVQYGPGSVAVRS